LLNHPAACHGRAYPCFFRPTYHSCPPISRPPKTVFIEKGLYPSPDGWSPCHYYMVNLKLTGPETNEIAFIGDREISKYITN